MSYNLNNINVSNLIDKTVDTSQNVVFNSVTYYNSFPGSYQVSEQSIFNPLSLNYSYNGNDLSSYRCAVFKDITTTNTQTQIIAPTVLNNNSQSIIPTSFTAICIGGGGGGASGGAGHNRTGTNNAGGGGGGGGSGSYGVLYKYDYNPNITVFCGAGGAGGGIAIDQSSSGQPGFDGSNGQSSYIQSPNVQGNLILVPGGTGGQGGQGASGVPGLGGVGGLGGTVVVYNPALIQAITPPAYTGSDGGNGGNGGNDNSPGQGGTYNGSGGIGGSGSNTQYLYTRIPSNNNGAGGAGGAGGDSFQSQQPLREFQSKPGNNGNNGFVRIFYLYQCLQSYSSPITGSLYNSSTYSAYSNNPLIKTIDTSPFTIEFWIYPTFSTSTQGIIGFGLYSNNDTTNGRLTIFYSFPSALGCISVQNAATGAIITSVAVPINTWTHCAITRNDNNLVQIYINGILGGTNANWNTNFNNGNVTLFIPYSDKPLERFVGYISVLKISNSCFYNNNFIPSASLFNKDIYTLLLLNIDSSTNMLKDSSIYQNIFNNSGLTYSSTIKPV